MIINKIKLVKGDITKMDVDVIVNAANSQLLPGGGVDGAIHKAGGKSIAFECIRRRLRHGTLKVGEVFASKPGKLLCKRIYHTVGPKWKKNQPNQDYLLGKCYKNALSLLVYEKYNSIAFPTISTGVFHYPKQDAASIALSSVLEFLHEYESINEVYFVCYTQENYDIYENLLKQHKENVSN